MPSYKFAPLIIISLFQIVAAGPAGALELPPEVLNGLQHRSEEIQPITIDLDKRAFDQEWTSAVSERPIRIIHSRAILTLQGGMLYYFVRLYQSPDSDEVYTDSEQSFDGSTLVIGASGKTGLIRSHPGPVSEFRIEYLENAGFKFDETQTPTIRSNVRQVVGAGELAGVDSTRLDDRSIERVKVRVRNRFRDEAAQADLVKLAQSWIRLGATEAAAKGVVARFEYIRKMDAFVYEEYYLDRAMDYALLERRTITESGEVIESVKNGKFEKIQTGDRTIWLAKESSFTNFISDSGLSSKPQRGHHIEVSRLSGDSVPSSRFVINYTAPGTMIRDETGKEVKEYIIPATATDLDRAAANVKDTSPVTSVDGRSNNAGRVLVIIGSAAALLVVAGIWYSRWGRTAQ